MIESQWTKHELNDVEVSPKELASVKFSNVEINELGQILTPTQVQNPPTLSWSTKPDSLYAVFMMDPDAPSRKNPKKREWYHWGVLNIPGMDISNGETIAEYIGAGPPQKTGLHRYVILIYEQPGKLKSIHPHLRVSGDGRGNQNVKSFAASYKLGSPIAGNSFQAEWDDYVPKLYAKFK